MAYYFAVKINSNTYEGVNIKKSEQFQKNVPGVKPIYECTLEEIDRFTTMYSNDSNLRNSLYGDCLIPWCYYNYCFSIICIDENETRVVDGDLLFADSKKYLENRQLVIDYILQKFKEKDNEFLKLLGIEINEGSISVIMPTKSTLEIRFEREMSENLIFDIVRSLIYCYSVNVEGEFVISEQIDYEKFHNIVSFISIYEKELKLNNSFVRKRKPQ